MDACNSGAADVDAAMQASHLVRARSGPELSVIVPTFNERDNVAQLAARVGEALRGVSWELIFVDDDSPDGTADAVRNLAESDSRVRCMQRVGRRGLSSACIEGMLSSAAPYLAVIDGDLQHDETLLPDMLRTLKETDAEIVVGSRYMDGGGIGDWDARRASLSRVSTWLAKKTLRVGLSDPMSGFFALRRDVFQSVMRKLSSIGFKILLDIFASAERPLRYREMPYSFRSRQAGESKVDNRVALDFLTLLLQKRFGRLMPTRLIYFCLVGGIGVAVHLAVFAAAFHQFGLTFVWSQLIAALVAMAANYTFNNSITYRDRRLAALAWWRGLLLFCLACSVGALGNVGIAAYIFTEGAAWLPSALVGVLVGTVWNYATTAFYVWREN